MTLAPSHPGKKFALGAVGLSIEADELATRDLSASHESLVTLMRQLGPGVLRLGGNSLDRSWWEGRAGPSPAWATSVVTPVDLVRLHGLLAAAGWRVILGVDLGHFDPRRAADEARAALRILGSRLLGVEIGNEPNNYGTALIKLRPSSYGLPSYLRELAVYGQSIRATAPRVRLFGPDMSSPSWLPWIASDKGAPFAALTQHYYPTTYSISRGDCKGTTVPTGLELLSTDVRERESALARTLVSAGATAGSETRITETNTTSSCDADGGPATSPVFASALWSLDWVLRAAAAGIAGVNFHGYVGRCGPDTLTPICAPSNAAETKGRVIARPEYYGLLAARQLEGGRFVPVALNRPPNTNTLTTYATVDPHGVVTVAIDNFAVSDRVPLLIKISGYKTATGRSLSGSSISATSGVSFARTSFSQNGNKMMVLKAAGLFRLEIGPATALVVTLRK